MKFILPRLLALWLGLPLSWRKAATDFWTYATAGITTLSVTLPDHGDWRNWAIGLGLAVVGVGVNALRRAWLSNQSAVLGDTVELVANEAGFELSPAQVQKIAELVAAEIEKRAKTLAR